MAMPQFLDSCAEGVYVKQQFNIMKSCSTDYGCCDLPNRYKVYKKTGEKMTSTSAMTYYMTTNLCERLYCQGMLRRYTMFAHMDGSADCQPMTPKDTCMRVSKSCKCTICCWCRQEQLCWSQEGGSENYLGKVHDPCRLCDCCWLQVFVTDSQGRDDYKVRAYLCQMGFFCKCPCTSCNTINFEICAGDTSNTVGHMMKRFRACCTDPQLGEESDCCNITFPKGATWQQKAMLCNAAVYLEYNMMDDWCCRSMCFHKNPVNLAAH